LGQVPWQMPPQPSGSPHWAPVQAGTQETHAPWRQSIPGSQQTAPQVTLVHWHAPLTQVWFGPAHGPWQMPPHPSAAPQALPAQLGVQHAPWEQACPCAQHAAPQAVNAHWHTPLTQVWFGPAQVPWHTPPQPSAAPQALPAQLGVQHAPATQTSPCSQQSVPQGEAQTQVNAGPHVSPRPQEPQDRVPPHPFGGVPQVADRLLQVAGAQHAP